MRYRCAFLVVVAASLAAHAEGEDWPQFRGPTGQGLSKARDLPVSWSDTENVAWKTPIPGKGWSSPIVYKDHVYLTTAVKGTRTPLSLRALCLREDTGTIVGNVEAFSSNAPTIQQKNSHASPTPLIEGGRLFVDYGHHAVGCIDLQGNRVWRNMSLRYDPVHGSGGSPVLTETALIVSIDGAKQTYVVALDRATGQPLWRADRRSRAVKKFSFCTPLVIEVDGQQQVICPGSDSVIALDARNGKEIWRARYKGYSVIPRPVYGNGLVFVCTGYDRPKLIAIRPTGKGDVTRTHIAWGTAKGAPHTPSPLLVDDALYMVSDRGVASCLDAKTGTEHWRQRIGGNHSASPVHADGKIYFQSEEGVGTVIRAAKTFERLGQNDLGERTLASFAIANNSIYLRTEQFLYRIQRKTANR